ncbi:hypothetical protein N799_13945 [Lysobacter arseniciresistens ZS79]|uniref:YhdP central domain-containing protein n=1 Tax=Lysobacter arseniciresistens ZS79 TaxID=913325 RepID=A0A0A0F3H2_9GAMM|nr:YhdP family protein [Lysobacter arseniciresistens]KGM57105.1 hypothetical protein N799_13945 [Lysobacter arseniciresistens ZS79]
MTALRRHLRRVRRGLGYTVAVVLVLVALVLGVASQVLPLAERNPERIAQWLSQRAGRPLAFDRVETEWTRRGPLLRLDNLRVGAGDEAFTVGDTEMLVSIYAGLLPGTPLSELRVRGLDLTLERTPDGRWHVRGLPGQQQSGADPFDALERLGELQVIDARLAVVAPQLGIDTRLPQIDLRLRVDGDGIRAGVRAWPARGGSASEPLEAVLELDRDSGDGRVYAGARAVDLSHWAPLLELMGVAADAGTGRAEAWATLDGLRVVQVTAAGKLDGVVLRGAPLSPTSPAPRVRLRTVDTLARWQQGEDGWRLDAPRLQVTTDDGASRLDGLLLAGGERFAVRSQHLDIAPLVSVASLSDRLPAGLRRWLLQARPHAVLREVEVAGRRDGPMRAVARIDGFGFAPVGDRPGMRGLAGRFEGDADGFQFALDPAASWVFDWPSGFGRAHATSLAGTVTGWREGDGWRIGTDALRIDGDDFGATARGSLWWQGDGSRPWLDVAATIDETALPVAKGFWVRHLMPETVVEWLDTALVAGTVRNGRALVSGDLDDWPFTGNDGRFEATAHIADATIRFQPDWPAAEQVELEAAFIGDGFALEGSGALGGFGIDELTAGIDHYNGGRLAVDADGRGDAAQLVKVLRASPLRELHPETFDSVQARGPAAVDFNLRLPLGHGEGIAIDGEVELAGARLSDPRWELAFDRVNGRAVFDRHGFHADGLQVRHDGRPGVLRLRAGEGHVRARGNVFEAGIEADFGIDKLLGRASQLAWLEPHVDGRSRWNVDVTVPKDSTGDQARLQLRSDLAGTALSLPAPLGKPAGTTLATTVGVPLPLDAGEVRVSLGQRLAARARSVGDRTGIRVVLGSGRVDQPPPASGLVATGRAATLDAIGWLGLVGGGADAATGGSGLALERIDVTADNLQLLGGGFPDTRLLVVPAPGGATAVRTEGASLQGELLLPAGDGAVAGRFARVHWRPSDAAVATVTTTATTTPASAATPTAAQAATAGINPAGIPPLLIEVDDLRLVDAVLGKASLQTRPTAAGLRVEKLHARSGKQVVDITGSWLGRGASERTHVAAKVDSEDFGQLLAGLGHGGRLAGGEGQMRLDAGWTGSPAEFSVATLDGDLTLAARDGRLLEVEPGAGRVLGLLSIAELPRRLSLDFRDFFSKGFAFNHIEGRIGFARGLARSDNLQIDGPAAEINIRGAANLREETFNQTIEVLPKTGNLLTAVGAIAGGPVGAAIGAAANAVLQKPLGQIGAKTYKVTGPWEEPEVEVISREQGRLSAAQAVPAG